MVTVLLTLATTSRSPNERVSPSHGNVSPSEGDVSAGLTKSADYLR